MAFSYSSYSIPPFYSNTSISSPSPFYPSYDSPFYSTHNTNTLPSYHTSQFSSPNSFSSYPCQQAPSYSTNIPISTPSPNHFYPIEASTPNLILSQNFSPPSTSYYNLYGSENTEYSSYYHSINYPVFDGKDDAYGWVLDTEKYFKTKGTSEEDKMAVTAMAMRGEALKWWLWFSECHPNLGWEDFTNHFLWRFKPEFREVLPISNEEEPKSHLKEETKELFEEERDKQQDEKEPEEQRNEEEKLDLVRISNTVFQLANNIISKPSSSSCLQSQILFIDSKKIMAKASNKCAKEFFETVVPPHFSVCHGVIPIVSVGQISDSTKPEDTSTLTKPFPPPKPPDRYSVSPPPSPLLMKPQKPIFVKASILPEPVLLFTELLGKKGNSSCLQTDQQREKYKPLDLNLSNKDKSQPLSSSIPSVQTLPYLYPYDFVFPAGSHTLRKASFSSYLSFNPKIQSQPSKKYTIHVNYLRPTSLCHVFLCDLQKLIWSSAQVLASRSIRPILLELGPQVSFQFSFTQLANKIWVLESSSTAFLGKNGCQLPLVLSQLLSICVQIFASCVFFKRTPPLLCHKHKACFVTFGDVTPSVGRLIKEIECSHTFWLLMLQRQQYLQLPIVPNFLYLILIGHVVWVINWSFISSFHDLNYEVTTPTELNLEDTVLGNGLEYDNTETTYSVGTCDPGGKFLMFKVANCSRLKQWDPGEFFPMHMMAKFTRFKQWDPGENFFTTMASSSIQFKQWDPGKFVITSIFLQP